ncbi:AraC family transcriptional regulator [Sphingomonas oleivorans]|uniref:AraC family transcriptional regulator n=1 Tax=Sphingomonas oleivorans TaxID=1735121 RepID=A0A2T5FTT6_9SPHN|nr:AraC family transcriptional regulator [Sphingomonas oleivorans]PTQ07474.1 AraC family transcriptional regulator [Sphingomonas oleivorans]
MKVTPVCQRTQEVPPAHAVFPLPLAAKLVADADEAIEGDPALARACLRQIALLIEGCDPEGSRASIRLRPVSVDGPVRGGLATWQIRLVAAHIEANLSDTIHVETLAEIARLSSGHFCRAFKTSIGETPHTHIVRRRLERAKMLMLTTSETLSQIACACGLTDQAHLTRLFRQHVGDTPLNWRRKWRQAA